MRTCLYNGYMNPFAYLVFPQLYDIEPKTDDFIEQARFNGTLRVISMSDESDDLVFTNTDEIDLSPFAGKEIRISLDNKQGGVILGGWVLPGLSFVQPIASYRCYDKTNDDADRNVLTDLTGNGHDIQLYNFAFAESSGYGKYAVNFLNYYLYNKTVDKRCNGYVRNNKFYINEIFTTRNVIERVTIGKSPIIKIKVSGLNRSDITLIYKAEQGHENVPFYEITEDGIYELPSASIETAYGSGFSFNKTGTYSILIEQIPDYQGALVSDGVDDYGLCNNFPILTKEKGYTVCAIRSIIDIVNLGSLLSNNNSSYTDGAFSFDYYSVDETKSEIRAQSFGNFTVIVPQPNRNTLFVYQTKTKYNGCKLNVGSNSEGSQYLNLFVPIRNALRCSSIALYALEIYDRDLTDEEIAKVKARMIAEYESKTGNKYKEETA